ncbi:MAG: sigma-70 family RNA polymerase sigma factor [Planctomycetota bacterium]|nr:MAG: sigma-70 family RNA polymerase sigma factor [Planctomycetota bacterium]
MARRGETAPRRFEPYTGDVYGWAYRVLGRHHDALDVVQEVFLRWNAQCEQSVPDRPRGWLRRVTLNRAIDLRRRMMFEASVPARGQVRERTAQPEPGATLDREMLRAEVAAALASLSDMQRSVLVAKVYDGMTFAQIAAELDAAVPTVKTHYLRALRAMRARLKRWDDGEKE